MEQRSSNLAATADIDHGSYLVDLQLAWQTMWDKDQEHFEMITTKWQQTTRLAKFASMIDWLETFSTVSPLKTWQQPTLPRTRLMQEVKMKITCKWDFPNSSKNNSHDSGSFHESTCNVIKTAVIMTRCYQSSDALFKKRKFTISISYLRCIMIHAESVGLLGGLSAEKNAVDAVQSLVEQFLESYPFINVKKRFIKGYNLVTVITLSVSLMLNTFCCFSFNVWYSFLKLNLKNTSYYLSILTLKSV
ncbi:hypothetical protein KUTeg_005728 [Tegillarca granosa]|uniref:Uncharacterized protein n=1 Tax=Tegillarca granosa TaxID=220873 RepID=A0ABQ9FHC9_TEGGR|nr:hypothetical protein KUTeg_005728 [Tegillarca granosa]